MPHAHPDGRRHELRGLVRAVADSMTADDGTPLRTAWDDLVAALALGPDPAVRTCPKCGAICMAAAALCGYCWTAFEPTHDTV